jgi:hypothetical protein
MIELPELLTRIRDRGGPAERDTIEKVVGARPYLRRSQ